MRIFARGFKVGIFRALFYLVIASVIIRMTPHYIHAPVQWSGLLLMGLYLVLFISEQLVSEKTGLYFNILFTIQLLIILALIVIPSETAPKDYFGNLVLPLCGLAVLNMAEKPANRWIAVFCTFCLISMAAYYRDFDGLSFGLVYITGSLFAVVLIRSTLRADRERAKSEALLEELKSANQKLEEYSRQVQTLAAAEERNRLARELHDSVSQTIFSMNLTAESAKILIDRDANRVRGLLDHLQVLSQNALAEMRSLITHLRPSHMAEEGLISVLKSHVNELQKRNELTVDLTVAGCARLDPSSEDGVFRIIQEALNNVIKHAQTDRASVTLELAGGSAKIIISDHGKGFDNPIAGQPPGKFGISGMIERAEALGADLKITSKPGEGTTVSVEGIPTINESDTASKN